MAGNSVTPGIGKRLLSLSYEILLLLAVVLLAGGIGAALAQVTSPPNTRAITQIVVALTSSGYFAWQWHRGGQTLAMKTWRIRLVQQNGDTLTLRQAVLRFFLALLGLVLGGAGFWWALADRDRQFLHDRIVGTRLVRVPRKA